MQHIIDTKRAALSCALMVAILLFVSGNDRAQATFALSTPSAKPSEAVYDVALSIPLPAVKPMAKSKMPAPQNLADKTKILANDATIPMPAIKPHRKRGDTLERADALLYKQIFAAQAEANWKEADRLLLMTRDERLHPYVMYERFMHPTSYTSKFSELRTWLDLYADYPGADDVYKLARTKQPSDFKGRLQKPQVTRGVRGYLNEIQPRAQTYRTTKKRSSAQNNDIAAMEKKIERFISRGAPTAGYHYFKDSAATSFMDQVEQDRIIAKLANSYMMAGKLDEALSFASRAFESAHEKAPMAGWIAGLVSWRVGDYAQAAQYFSVPAQSPYASSWMQAAASFWAGRSFQETKNFKQARHWYRRAADHPRTFYGLIGAQALGKRYNFHWDTPSYTKAHHDLLIKYDGVKRAMLLISADQHHLADRELRTIPVESEAVETALIAFAHEHALPAFAMRLASARKADNGALYDSALYPVMSWVPEGGYQVDRSLIHALIRQESKFKTDAANKSGATGLMQLMPQTATAFSDDHDFRNVKGRQILKNPQENLNIGQRYVVNLMSQKHIGNDLFALVIAYNAGPGNLRKWQRELSDVYYDPLLFIETIPVAETRAFLERVVANFWLYRMRLGQDVPSLAQLVDGQRARYAALEDHDNYKTGRAAMVMNPFSLASAMQTRMN